jgi:parallel beta-helix repeat protein
MNRSKSTLMYVWLFGLAFAPTASDVFAQGALIPPGAPAPTMKTLEQVEPRTLIASLPYTITNSGSYYLATNLTGASGFQGIIVSADSVFLDLNGFSLIGVPGSSNGIFFSGNRQDVVVRNGVIRNWGVDGIVGNGARGVHYLGLHVANNGRGGLSGDFATVVRECSAISNALWGIAANTGSTVSDSTARGNGSDGFIISNDSTTLHRCASSDNGGSGFFGSGNNHFVNCSAGRNKVHGFTGGGNVFRGCIATFNSTNGFFGSFGAVLEGCRASNNSGDGIQVGGSSRISGSDCSSNGFSSGDGAGIHATGGFARIEDNSVYSNDRGIQVDGIRNIIFRNTAVGNTINYVIAGTNHVGVIVSPTNSAAITGSTGGAGLSTTDPWANFSH